jgi:hypothetical protein
MITKMHVLLVVCSIGLPASAQSLPPTRHNWGPIKDGVRNSLSLDKPTYAVGEEIPLHIAAQVVSARHHVYGDFSMAFHLTVLDEDGLIVGDDDPSNLRFGTSDSIGPTPCQAPLKIGHVYKLGLSAGRQPGFLPTQPGRYRLTVTWSPYLASASPCGESGGASDSEKARPFVTVSSAPLSIHVTGKPVAWPGFPTFRSTRDGKSTFV